MKQKFLFSIFKKNKNEIEPSNKKASANTNKLNTADAKEYLKSGVAKFKLGKNNEALFDINKSIEINPDDPKAYMERSAIRLKLNDSKGAREDLEVTKIIIDRLDEGYKAYDQGGNDYDSGNYKEAIKNYDRAISLIPSLTDIYYNRGIAKRIIDNLDGAIEDFNKAIDLDASNKAYAYYDRGLIKYHKLNDSHGALADYNKAIELNPTEADFYCSKASLLSNYEAIECLNRAIELNPASAMIYFRRALREIDLEDYKGGIKDLDTYIEINPIDAEVSLSDAYSLRASMKTFQNDFNSALQDHNKAIELDPTYTKSFFDRGVLKDTLKDYDGAINDFTKMIEVDSTDATSYYYRGMAKIKKGQIEEGDIDIKKAKELGYADYDEEFSKKAAQEAYDIIREEVAKEIEINGQKTKGELDKEFKDLMEEFIVLSKKSKKE